MTQSLLTIALFIALIAALPLVLRRIRARQLLAPGAADAASRVVSAVAVGPQQRVVTVEVGPAHARTWLVLGVTAQAVNCLQTLPAASVLPAQELGDA
ncbi:FliO/MopB family protein [Pseudacidovorax intermedius]|uniref:Flagellar protein FliO/FliZ n=1 Tax=Pseudacidovorax intermedius TaxID=433924 RepID=A0A370F7R0_9BURK|nr:flagellar biosynthetic protein FliO [Pseudacidovorax intermedius]RDI19522.1 flagellar protein FliO/FliZ [Pseudacidovorax intermedius]